MRKIYFSFVSIVLLLTSMSFAAFGYFTAGVDSGSNRIVAANYTLDIQILQGEEDLYTSNTMTLAPGQYAVNLSYVAGSASTGFCKIEVGNQCYYTLQIGVDDNAENDFREKVSFTLIVEREISVKFVPIWGTSVYYGGDDPCYVRGDTLTIA